MKKELTSTSGAKVDDKPRRRPRTSLNRARRTVPMRRVTWSDARLPPGTTTVSKTSRKVIQARITPGRMRMRSRVTDRQRRSGCYVSRPWRALTKRAPLSSWAAGSSRADYRQPDTRYEQAPGHEDSQFIEVAQD